MRNLSTESCAPLADPAPAWPFRATLEPQDASLVERLVAHTGVFNTAEIAMARGIVEESYAAQDGGGYRFLMADGRAGLDGYTCYGPIPGTDNRYELYWIVTAVAARRRGLARALLEATEADARARGGTHLFIETSTRSDYVPAHALYGALGYEPFGMVPDYHGDGDGLTIFGKRL